MSWANLIHELGHLKRVPRSGWALVGIRHPESVADHTFRASTIAYMLAVEEDADADRACAMTLFHDMGEARVGDLHRLAKSYAPWDGVEEQVVEDQLKGLPPRLAKRLRGLSDEYRAQETLEAKIAKDADRLECLFQAREYAASGHSTDEWIKSSQRELTTEAARRLAEECLRTTPAWWRNAHRQSP